MQRQNKNQLEPEKGFERLLLIETARNGYHTLNIAMIDIQDVP